MSLVIFRKCIHGPDLVRTRVVCVYIWFRTYPSSCKWLREIYLYAGVNVKYIYGSIINRVQSGVCECVKNFRLCRNNASVSVKSFTLT